MKLFRELLLVSLGRLDGLSITPTIDDWNREYELANNHALVGICFNAIEKLHRYNGNQLINLPNKLRMQWLGMACSIQRRNELLNVRCLELQEKLFRDGFKSCILKGQGIAEQYSSDLSNLRQSGDIDVWINGSYKTILSYILSVAPTNKITDIHIDLNLFDDAEVEVHFLPAYLSNRVANKKLKQWFWANLDDQFNTILPSGIHVPTDSFNRIYILLHIYRHLFGEGIGLRQVMDLYFVLQRSCFSCEDCRLLKQFRVLRFAQGLNWIMQYMFENDGDISKYIAVGIDEKVGRFLLNEIMQMGNFGHSDRRFKKSESGHFSRFIIMIKSKLRFIYYFPQEVLWQPIDIIRRFFTYRSLRSKATRMQIITS